MMSVSCQGLQAVCSLGRSQLRWTRRASTSPAASTSGASVLHFFGGVRPVQGCGSAAVRGANMPLWARAPTRRRALATIMVHHCCLACGAPTAASWRLACQGYSVRALCPCQATSHGRRRGLCGRCRHARDSRHAGSGWAQRLLQLLQLPPRAGRILLLLLLALLTLPMQLLLQSPACWAPPLPYLAPTSRGAEVEV